MFGRKSATAASKKDSRRQFKLDKIKAVTEKAKAVATKRKWLVILLVVGIVVFIFVKAKGIF